MEFKHLRGKHDQKDHGRQTSGGGSSQSRGGAGTTARSEVSQTLSDDLVAQTPRGRIDRIKEKIQASQGRIQTIEQERTKAQRDVRAARNKEAQLVQYLEQNGGTLPPEAREVYVGYLATVLQDVQLAQGRVAEANNRIVGETSRLEALENIQASQGRIQTIEQERTKAQRDVQAARDKEAQLLQYLEQNGRTLPPEAREVFTGYLATVLQDVQLAQGRVAEANNRIVEEAGRLETFRLSYNDLVKAAQEQRAAGASQ